MKLRRPYVAGSFYPRSKDDLRAEIEGCFKHRLGPGEVPIPNAMGSRRIVALVCPHAGYTYSGPTMARSYHALALDGSPRIFVILGPNHTGLGSAVSMWDEGFWETPLGRAEVDSGLAAEIRRHCGMVDVEEMAHRYEHSIEVQLPFLQYLFGEDVKFVPICMMMQDLRTSVEVGLAVARAIRGKDAVIIASSDMTHYEPHEVAARRDRLAIEAIVQLDEESLQRVVEEHNVTMCGYGAVTAAIKAAKLLEATKGSLLGYSTSGDVTGDRGSVVGYLSASITR